MPTQVKQGSRRPRLFAAAVAWTGSLGDVARTHTAYARDHEMPEQARGRILVVEDEVDIAQMLAEVLTGDGHEVALANSGREALERIRQQRFDLILSDLRMPDLDGPGLYRELTASRPEFAERIVFITGDVLSPATVDFLSESVAQVLEKPLDLYDLRAKVRKHLAMFAWQSSVRTDDTACSLDHDIQAESKPPIPGSADPSFWGGPKRHHPEHRLIAAYP
jgi:CheY-like chemotaxis protein